MDDREAIRELVSRFFLAFDAGDWSALRRCLADELTVDYSDLRGEPPRVVGADGYVAAREGALEGLKTLHLSANPVVMLDGDRASCTCSALILRTSADGATFDTAARYEFGLRREPDGWRVDGIQQVVLWNRGDPRVHGALRDEI